MKIQHIFESFVPFTTSTTGMATYDDMMKNPDYHRDYKKWAFTIDHMSPDEYIRRAFEAFREHGHMQPHQDLSDLRRSRSGKLIAKYAEKMKQGEKFPMPTLDYRGQVPFGGGAKEKAFSQEGLHRAYAAKEAGVTEMPVMIIDDAE